MIKKEHLHPKNKHKSAYDFVKLCKKYPLLNKYIFTNKHNNTSIDYANPKAVKTLNTALLTTYYPISFWKFPEENLCPPIPGRVDYIHYLADILNESKINHNCHILDIGTGASCIFPLLGNAEYQWKFTATDIDYHSLKSAQNIIDKNKLSKVIELRHQTDKSNIFTGIVKESDHFQISMCNPPFFGSQIEAKEANAKKLKGLGIDKKSKNFSGNQNELWYPGGEKAFLHNYLYQSSLYKSQFFWFSILVSKKENIKSMYQSLNKLKATQIKTISMQQGNKISRIIVWTFLDKEQQKDWQV
jgi:23S rRNA (adenine1618-N6)-methyltransferase